MALKIDFTRKMDKNEGFANLYCKNIPTSKNNMQVNLTVNWYLPHFGN